MDWDRYFFRIFIFSWQENGFMTLMALPCYIRGEVSRWAIF
jgi:hypothetical protein